MPTTYTLQVPTLEDDDLKIKRIPLAGHSNFVLTDSQFSDTQQNASFTYSAGAAADVLTATTRRTYNAKTDVTNNSLRLSALVKTVVSETGAVSYEPLEAVIAWNHQGKILDDSSHAVQLISVAAAILFQELTGANGTPTTKIIDQFDHSVVTKLFG